jgi:hypothetical protein
MVLGHLSLNLLFFFALFWYMEFKLLSNKKKLKDVIYYYYSWYWKH